MQRFIIVGAGILGVSTAYHLAKMGARVQVIDRQDVGQATDAAAGIICPWLSQRRNKAWYQLAKNGAKYYDTLINELETNGETNTGYKKVGAICIHTEAEKINKLEERAYKRRIDAPEMGEIRRLTTAETQQLFPPLSEQYSSLFVSGAARVNGRAIRQSLENVARKYGAEFLRGSASIVFEENKVTGVKVEGRIFHADKVIVTVGAWANELLNPLGIHFKGTFQKGQIIHLHLPGYETDHWPVVLPPSDQYLLTIEDGRVVIGTTHEDDTGFDTRVTAGGVHEILTKALSVATGLKGATLLETRVGFRPYTPGHLPIIGELPHYEGILIANGLGASGLTIGPYLGYELAKIALGLPSELNVQNYKVTDAIEFRDVLLG